AFGPLIGGSERCAGIGPIAAPAELVSGVVVNGEISPGDADSIALRRPRAAPGQVRLRKGNALFGPDRPNVTERASGAAGSRVMRTSAEILWGVLERAWSELRFDPVADEAFRVWCWRE